MKNNVNAQYILTRDEVAEAFSAAGKLRFSKKKAALQTAGLILGMGVFTSYIIIAGFSLPYSVIIALCAVLIPIVWIMPMRTEQRIIDRAVSGQTTDVTISPGAVAIYIKASDFRWTIDEPRVKYTDTLIILMLADKRLFVIPKRVLSAAQLELAMRNLSMSEEQNDEKE